MNTDPRLSQFICNSCHTQFYRCHSILLDFRNRVNLTPACRDRNSSECSPAQEGITLFRSHITSDRRCLHGLVSWAHGHAEACRSCPDLQEVLEGQCQGALQAVWGCVDGHTYVMDTSGAQATSNAGPQTTKTHSDDLQSASRANSVHTAKSCEAAAEDMQSCELMDTDDADNYLSDRNLLSDEECEDRRKSGSSEDSSDLNTAKRCVSSSKSKEAKTLEPKARRKPGPKPGWKNNKAEREELPTIYKCPHQGCTAVYRGADGMKKHIKEHHEEVRERPCPHPGCNKVFMIDRYLQRHVKLIHTEVRNYICDECGQTFKQRKHLSVHQMRHSGAKPLQCEVCGFQCRQRASLKYHMTKHKAEADLEFACVICGKRFEKAHNLNVHMSMVHPLLQGGGVPAPDCVLDTNQ